MHARRILEHLSDTSTKILNRGGIRVHPPDGAFYLFLDFSSRATNLQKKDITDSKTLCEKLLLETGVAILPGEAFQRPCEELTARLAFVNFDGAKALEMSEAIPPGEPLPKNFGEKHCPEVLKAMEKIAEWANS